MKPKISILFILCILLFAPNDVYAQSIFAKQKVVIADVIDVNDCKLENPTKLMIRQSFVDACTKSDDYEVFEVNMDDIRKKIASRGQSVSFTRICEEIGEKADYIIFIEVMTNTSDRRNPNMKVFITSKLYRIATKSMELTDMAEAQPNRGSIMSAVYILLKKSLGIGSPSSFVGQQSQQSYSYGSLTNKTYKVGDRYEANGVQGVVFEVSSDGKHGKIMSFTQASNKLVWSSANTWCSNQGVGWRLPTKEELCLIYKSKTILNSTLASVNARLSDGYYWSLSEYNPSRAWLVHMNEDLTYNYDKSGYFYVRAVCAF